MRSFHLLPLFFLVLALNACRAAPAELHPVPDVNAVVRVSGPGTFTLLIPTDFKRLPDRPLDTRSQLYVGPGRRLVIAFGYTGGPTDAVGKINFQTWKVNVEGRTAQLASYMVGKPANPPYRFGFQAYVRTSSLSDAGINIALACIVKTDCDKGKEIVNSIRFY